MPSASPTSAQLKKYLTHDDIPSAVRLAYSENRDSDCASLLNVYDKPGAVHVRPLAAVITDRSLHGRLRLFRDQLKKPNGNAVEIPADLLVYSLVCDVLYILEQPGLNLRIPVDRLTLGTMAMIAAGLISSNDRIAILAAETRFNLMQVQWGLDTPNITHIQIAEARAA